MLKCSVLTCTNRLSKYDNLLQFYNFPVDLQLKNIWFSRCGTKSRNNIDSNSLKICSEHFMPDDFEEHFSDDYKKLLKYNAVPSRNIPGTNTIPSYNVIKDHVDMSEILQNKLKQLKKEKSDLVKKMKVYEQNSKIKKKNCVTLRNKIDKLRSNSSIFSSDRSLLSKVFSNAQIKILMGKRKVTWSDNDLAMAFSLRQMSSRDCYLYLKRFLNLPLPALSCVQKWASAKMTL